MLIINNQLHLLESKLCYINYTPCIVSQLWRLWQQKLFCIITNVQKVSSRIISLIYQLWYECLAIDAVVHFSKQALFFTFGRMEKKKKEKEKRRLKVNEENVLTLFFFFFFFLVDKSSLERKALFYDMKE